MALRARQNKTESGEKRRWTSEDRARRSSDAPSRGAAGGGARAQRRAAQFGAPRPDRDERRPERDQRRGDRDQQPEARGSRPDRRTEWYPGPRNADSGDRRGARGDRDRADRFGGQRDANRDRGRQYGAAEDRRGSDRRDDRDRDRQPRPAERAADRRAGGARGVPEWHRPERPQQRDQRPGRFERPERPERTGRSFDRDRRAGRPGAEQGSRPERFDRADPRPERAERTVRRDDARGQRDDSRYPSGSRYASGPRYEHRGGREDRQTRGQHAPSGRPDRRETGWTPAEDVVLERLEAETVTADEVEGSTFRDLGLGDGITAALAELGAATPFPIQTATIPDALAGRDVLGRGRTGSGKTIAFGAAVVERLMRNWHESGRGGSGRQFGRPPRALILAPTRELALQIDRTVQPIARSIGLFTTQIVGGVPQARQVGALKKGVDIVIGTPGRIEDLIEQRHLDLRSIEITVLDEADHMAELGFLEPMQRLLRLVPNGGQRLMFSATLDTAVSALVDEFLVDPAVHEVADTAETSTTAHRVLVIEQGEKLPVLTALLGSVDRSLVFARTRAFAEQLADELEDRDVRAESLHGDLNQSRRTRALQRFSEGRVAAMVATDVAARGIHVDEIDLVVHADAAEDYKTYLHRSGRTGRAGAAGTVVTLITARRRRRFAELLERAEIEADFTVLRPGADPVAALAR